MAKNAIEVNNLAKTYGAVRALSGVSFEVRPGEIVGLLGPNGAGKTTLMKILTGFLMPDSGIARVGGIDVVERPLDVQRTIGYLPESAPLYHDMRVQEYLQMIADLRGVSPTDRRRLLSAAIYAAGLENHLTRPIGHLSKGYRQRVGIAQAILHEPDVLILDEPTSGLDPSQIAEIRDLIRRLAEQATVILSTHILPEVEMTCERVLMIIRGRLRANAHVDELRAGNAAVVQISADATGVTETLEGLAGVTNVEAGPISGGFRQWRVVASDSTELCPVIYNACKNQPWSVAELRTDTRTLESVFRQLAESPDLDTEEVAA